MKQIFKKLICLLFGHDDPAFAFFGFIPDNELYERWKNWDRNCQRCNKKLLTN